MANPNQIAILEKGVDVWNAWRDANPKVIIDLSVSELPHRKLRKVNFSRAILPFVNLEGSDLEGADLRGANLSYATLTDTNLKRTNLCDAFLKGAYICGSDFGEARLGATVFAFTDLSAAKGLDTCRHSAPSAIDFPTLGKAAPLPLSFLRGCGISDDYITYMNSSMNAAKFHSCFISYATEDMDFVSRLYWDLQDKGVRCWLSPHDAQGGRKLEKQIYEAILLYDRLLLVLSRHSMEREWVKTEIAKARKREIREKQSILFPIRLVPFETLRDWECFDADTGKDSAREIREYFIPDFSHWKDPAAYQEAFSRLINDLRKKPNS